MTPARQKLLADTLAATPASAETTTDTVGAQTMLLLQHHLRSLKQMQSIERRIAAKVDMLPSYADFLGVQLDADVPATGVAAEVLPTIMVWAIDVGDWPRALALAAFVLRHDVALPARYQRSAPALIAEEIAAAALKAQKTGTRFPLDVLEQVEALTADADMHDEIRAKLHKALGQELAAQAEATEGDAARPLFAAGRAALVRAQTLHDRVGVATRVAQIDRAIAANLAAFPPPAPAGGGESETPAADAPGGATDTDTTGGDAGPEQAGDAG